jgi:hypothetical protein
MSSPLVSFTGRVANPWSATIHRRFDFLHPRLSKELKERKAAINHRTPRGLWSGVFPSGDAFPGQLIDSTQKLATTAALLNVIDPD